ncbi:MAG TPA: hypothetical protein VGV38_20675, partial [Pyrinomonadaceae bacterium]|nr:hypothetical protein [Pyrinomonadaceae bacterium]
MKLALVLVAIAASLPTPAGASPPAARGQEQSCPVVHIACPESVGDKPATCSAEVSGGEPSAKPTYNWIISGGRILEGQGTPRVSV